MSGGEKTGGEMPRGEKSCHLITVCHCDGAYTGMTFLHFSMAECMKSHSMCVTRHQELVFYYLKGLRISQNVQQGRCHNVVLF